MDRYHSIDWSALAHIGEDFIHDPLHGQQEVNPNTVLAQYTPSLSTFHATMRSVSRIPAEALKFSSFPQFTMIKEQTVCETSTEQWIRERTEYLNSPAALVAHNGQGLNTLRDMSIICPYSLVDVARDVIVIHRPEHFPGICLFDVHRAPSVSIARDDRAFRNRFNQLTFNVLRYFSFDHCVVAGGAAASALFVPDIHFTPAAHAEAYGNMDIDVFFHGCSISQALEVIREIELTVQASIGAGKAMHISTTQSAITITPPRPFPRVQCILRIYSSVEQILNGFDLGVAGIAWDNRQLRIHDRAAHDIHSKTQDRRGEQSNDPSAGYILLSPTHILNDSRYLPRLIHYARRGFGTAIARADMTHLSLRVRNHLFAKAKTVQEETVKALDVIKANTLTSKPVLSYRSFCRVAQRHRFIQDVDRENIAGGLSALVVCSTLYHLDFVGEMKFCLPGRNSLDYVDEDPQTHPYSNPEQEPGALASLIRQFNAAMEANSVKAVFGSSDVELVTENNRAFSAGKIVHIIGASSIYDVLDRHQPLCLPLLLPSCLALSIANHLKTIYRQAGLRTLPTLVPVFTRANHEAEQQLSYRFVVWHSYPQVIWTRVDPRLDSINKLLNTFHRFFKHITSLEEIDANDVLEAEVQMVEFLTESDDFERWLCL
uniref:Uncharacterized protein n=1 Tax=Mycena chlorophos TaxID=658473 RepID=A0ABQ0L396_MYCCL|nr:predicted protein [Mycena chlorophos]